MTASFKRIACAFALAFTLCAASCGKERRSDELLAETLKLYASAVRWGDADQAVGFLDPELVKSSPSLNLELERLRQVRIANYTARAVTRPEPGRAEQIVQIEVVNAHTQIVRTVVDRQVWRFDARSGRWWLASGLPKIVQ